MLSNVIQAKPRPKLSRGARMIFPAGSKNAYRSSVLVSSSRFLTKTS